METTNYGIIWSQNVHFVTTLLESQNKTKLLNKSCYGICAYEGNSVKTTKYGIILSQNIHFVTTVPLMRTGVLYPRVRDFLFNLQKLLL